MSPEEVKFLAREEATPQLRGTGKRLFVLAALFLFLCALIRGVSSLARMTVGKDGPFVYVAENSWGCQNDGFTPALHDQLWCDNLQSVNAAYTTDLIQGILDGSLDVSAFDAFQIQVAYWKKEVADIYANVCKHTDCPVQLSGLFEHISDSYTSDAKETLSTHKLRPSMITPNDSAKNFVEYLQSVSRTHPAPYNAVAIASHLRLWVELATRLKNKGVVYRGGQYGDWVASVIQSGPELIEAASILDTAMYYFDRQLAKQIYSTVLQHNIKLIEMISV